MRYDVIVAGGGIVGLASALQILEKRPGTSLLLVEKEKSVALHQTGNNSGVIHSGIYYKPGSLKATNCLNGYNLLLAFCNAHGIKYDLCGKIIVATQPSEIEMLKTIQDRGIANGLTGLKNLNKEQLAQYEPHVAGIAGLYVPQTGIIDYTEVSEIYNPAFGHQYLFGPAFLVVPQTSDQKFVKIFFPEAGWYDLYNDHFHAEKGTYIAEAPVHRLPVFVRAGSIVPMENPRAHTDEPGDGILQIHVWKATAGSFSFNYYEDDGKTYAFENGEFSEREITYNAETGQIRMAADAEKYKSRFEKVKFVLHGFAEAPAAWQKEKNRFFDQIPQFDPFPSGDGGAGDGSECFFLSREYGREEMVFEL